VDVASSYERACTSRAKTISLLMLKCSLEQSAVL